MSSELKPCPFCDVKKTWLRKKMGMYYVICESCGSRTGYWFSEKQAIAAWNTRAERTCKYVHKEGFFKCSDCKCTVQLMCDFEPTIYAEKAITPNYCPNCGARVEGD